MEIGPFRNKLLNPLLVSADKVSEGLAISLHTPLTSLLSELPSHTQIEWQEHFASLANVRKHCVTVTSLSELISKSFFHCKLSIITDLEDLVVPRITEIIEY